MTHAEISKLSDEQLDALVAEKVMGWPVFEGDPPDFARCVVVCARGSFAFGAGAKSWHPSTDIAAAWEVLQWMRKTDCDVSLCSCGAAWLVDHNLLGPGLPHERAERAICEAALQLALLASERVAVK